MFRNVGADRAGYSHGGPYVPGDYLGTLRVIYCPKTHVRTLYCIISVRIE